MQECYILSYIFMSLATIIINNNTLLLLIWRKVAYEYDQCGNGAGCDNDDGNYAAMGIVTAMLVTVNNGNEWQWQCQI